MTRVNGIALEDYKRFEIRESGLAVPAAEPLYKPVIANGIPVDDFILDQNLVLYLPLHYLKGDSFKSVDRYGHSITVYGALWRPQGRYYDGADDYIEGTADVLNFTSGAFSILIWVKPTTGNTRGFFHRGLWNTSGYRCRITSTRALHFRTFTAGANRITTSDTGVVTNDTWALISFIRSGSSITPYYNTTDVTSSAGVHLDPVSHDGVFGLGETQAGGFEVAAGVFGEVFVYNRAISAGELTYVYNATRWRYQ